MAVYCGNNDYCVTGTGFPAYDDVYTNVGIYNLKDYYVGSTNGYYIFYDSGGFWCLATTLGGSPCFLQGKYPYDSVCPDLTFEYVNASVCPTPTPTPTVGCDVFNFEAKLIPNANPTPTPSCTPTLTPTKTTTPTPTDVCPNIYVDAIITGITPSQTPTPTVTPTIRILRNAANQIECNFSGDVTFITVDSIISCPLSKQFQDCNDGRMYYTTNVLTNPSGGEITQFMIFLSVVDGVSKCITYLGNNSTNIGINNITLTTGPIGYSNLGGCSLCTIPVTPSPTPTPTITMTPSGGIILSTCSTFVISEGDIYSYNVNTDSLVPLTVPNVSNWQDIANTTTKLFISTSTKIKEWNITLSPFTATFVRELSNGEPSVTFSTGLFAINDNKLLNCNVEIGVIPQYIFEINLPSVPSTSLNSSNYTILFYLPSDRTFTGDLLVTNTNKVIFTNKNASNQFYISQYTYPGGTLEVDVLLSPTVGTPTALFIDSGILYVIDIGAIVYSIDLTPPYNITVITSPGLVTPGASNNLSCNNIEFESEPVRYYKYILCNDNEGPQTIVYQTEPSITTTSPQTILDLTTNSCWRYEAWYTSVPSNTTNDIIVFEGNYFSEVSSTIFTNCTQCVNANPCQTPIDQLIPLSFKSMFTLQNGTNVLFSDFSVNEICQLYNNIYNNGTSGVVIYSSPVGVSSISVGAYVYSLLVNETNCQCVQDGSYISGPNTFFNWPDQITIITVVDCYITQINNCQVVFS